MILCPLCKEGSHHLPENCKGLLTAKERAEATKGCGELALAEIMKDLLAADELARQLTRFPARTISGIETLPQQVLPDQE